MRIHEILTESQLAQLDEGPIGSALGAVGRGVGKAVGGVAKGVGAVAGGVRGAFTALKKGYDTGKAVVGDDPDPNAGRPGYTYTPPADQAEPAAAPAAAPAAPAAAAPAAAPDYTSAPSLTTPPSAAEINAQGPKGSAPAKQQTGDAGKALARTTAVVDKTQAQSQEKANQTVYAQVKANVDKLDKKGKQRILQMLQKSMSAPQPAAPKAGAGAGAMGQMAAQLGGEKPNTMANAPVSKTNVAAGPDWDAETGAPISAKAKADYEKFSPKMKADIEQNIANQKKSATAPAAAPGAPAAAPAAAAAGQGAFANVAQQLSKPAKDPAVKAAADAALAKPGFQRTAADKLAIKAASETKSLVHRGKSLNEIFAQKLEIHKRRMFESALNNGTASVFVK